VKINIKQRTNNKFLEAARRAVRAVGWDARNDLEIVQPDNPSGGSAVRFGYRAGRIRLLESPNLFEQLASLRHIHDLGEPSDYFEDVVASRVYMQFGGWEVCPFSSYDYAEILEATSDGLRSAGMQEPQVQEFVVPITSIFIASVIAGTYALDAPNPPRFRRGWQLDQLVSSQANEVKLPMYSSLYAAIQLRLWADNQHLAHAVRDCFTQPFDALEFETDRGLAILLDSFEFEMGEEDGCVWQDDAIRESLLDELKYNYRSWPIKAFQWAEMLAPMVGVDLPDQQPPPQPSRGDRSQRPSAQASQRRAAVQIPDGAMQALLRQGEPVTRHLPCAPSDSFAERLANDSWFRQQVFQSLIGRGKGPLKVLPSFDVLDALYRNRAMKVEIECEPVKTRGTSFPIAHMTTEQIGKDVPTLNTINWGATRVSYDNELLLFRKQLPITDDIPVQMESGGFPDLLSVVDSSGSMRWDAEAGSGAYDSLLRAIYSVFQFLEKENKAQHMRFAAVNFSGSTLCTSWEEYSNIRTVKKMLFKHQAGGTQLDANPLQNMVSKCRDRFLCLMVTDGQIRNADEVAATVGSMASHGHGFVLIQIGDRTPFSEAINQLGLPVHVISDHTELEGLCLEYTKHTWKVG